MTVDQLIQVIRTTITGCFTQIYQAAEISIGGQQYSLFSFLIGGIMIIGVIWIIKPLINVQ